MQLAKETHERNKNGDNSQRVINLENLNSYARLSLSNCDEYFIWKRQCVGIHKTLSHVKPDISTINAISNIFSRGNAVKESLGCICEKYQFRRCEYRSED